MNKSPTALYVSSTLTFNPKSIIQKRRDWRLELSAYIEIETIYSEKQSDTQAGRLLQFLSLLNCIKFNKSRIFLGAKIITEQLQQNGTASVYSSRPRLDHGLGFYILTIESTN